MEGEEWTRRDLAIVTPKGTLEKIKNEDKNDPLVNILRVLKQDFDCTVMDPPDGEYGTVKNGSWTGMLGMVIRGNVDVSLANLGISYQRYEVVEFSQYLDIEAHRILSVVPQRQEEAEDVMHAFHHIADTMWALIFGCIVFTTLFCFVTLKFNLHAISSSNIKDKGRESAHSAFMKASPSYLTWYSRMISKKNAYKESDQSHVEKELRNGFLYYLMDLTCKLYGHIIGQGATFASYLSSSRIMFIGFVWSFFFFRNFFTGLIQTNLVVKETDHLIDDLEDVVKEPGIYPVVGTGTLVRETFETAKPGGPYSILWKRMQTRPQMTSLPSKELMSEKMLDMLASLEYVAVRSEPGIMDLGQIICIKRKDLKIHMSKSNLFDRQHGMVFRKSLAMDTKQRINLRLKSLVESGIYGHWLESKFGTTPRCFDHVASPETVEVSSMRLENAHQLFITVLIGYVISFVILGIEIALHRYLIPKMKKTLKSKTIVKRQSPLQMHSDNRIMFRRPRIGRRQMSY